MGPGSGKTDKREASQKPKYAEMRRPIDKLIDQNQCV